MAHRYWRLFLRTGETLTGLSGLSVLDGSGVELLTSSSFMSSPTSLQAGSLSSLIDGSPSDSLAQWNSNTATINFDFGSSVDVSKFSIYPNKDNVLRTGFGHAIFASDDGITYSLVAVTNNFTWTAGAWSDIEWPKSVSACRYWGLFQSDSTYALSMLELELRNSVGGADLTGSGVADAWTVFTGGEPSKAFDNSSSTNYSSNGPGNQALFYDFGSGNNYLVEEISVLARANGGFNENKFAPNQASILFSLDGINYGVYWSYSEAEFSDGESRVITRVQDEPEGLNSRVTQLPILVVDASSQPTEVTQLPILIVGQSGQPAEVTQLPVLVVTKQRGVPFPESIVPETPLTEIWQYLTVVTVTHRGLEQRSALRENPRIIIEFDAVILDDADREAVYSMLYRLIDEEFLYPAYQYSVTLTSKAAFGATSILFDATKTDVRSGETLAIFDPKLSRTYYSVVDEVTDTGATLVEGLPVSVPASWLVCPAYSCRFPGPMGLSMDSISGVVSLKLESMEPRSVERVSGTSLLTKYDNRVVLSKPHLAGADENFERDVDWLDVGTSIPQPMTDWRFTQVSGDRQYSFDRLRDIPYWRAFASHCIGRQNTFLIPTFRNDLPLAFPATVGTKEFVTTNLYAHEMLEYGPYNYGLVETISGSFYCKLLEGVLNYDASGNPESVTVKINETITAAIVSVSFVYTARLDSDEIKIEHDSVDSLITLPIRTVIE